MHQSAGTPGERGHTTRCPGSLWSRSLMPKTRPVSASASIHEAAHPVVGAARDYQPLYDLIGDARVVLLGEATHGTHEFYRERARITARLIEDYGFTVVAVEADWPDASRVNRWI